MFRFESLDIWHLARQYCVDVYRVVDEFPQKVQYSLGSQLRSSVLSVSNNIAEGSGSSSKQEFKNFLNYSTRSLYETVSALFVARDNGYVSSEVFDKIYADSELLVKKIRAFRNSL